MTEKLDEVVAGGYPVTRNGLLIGAVSCGGHGDLDESCALAGA